MNISKKQKMNSAIARLVQEWLYSLLPEDQIKLLTPEKIQQLMPQEPYFFSQGQIRVNAYTLNGLERKLKRLLEKPIKTLKKFH